MVWLIKNGRNLTMKTDYGDSKFRGWEVVENHFLRSAWMTGNYVADNVWQTMQLNNLPITLSSIRGSLSEGINGWKIKKNERTACIILICIKFGQGFWQIKALKISKLLNLSKILTETFSLKGTLEANSPRRYNLEAPGYSKSLGILKFRM